MGLGVVKEDVGWVVEMLSQYVLRSVVPVGLGNGGRMYVRTTGSLFSSTYTVRARTIAEREKDDYSHTRL